eukprot:6611689-Ditylum_brightwellii.AAC.1
MGTVCPTFEHVKGHQDKKKNYEDLLLPAKINVDADMLVVEFQAQNVVSTTTAIRILVDVV